MAESWFIAGTIPLMVAGGGHALATLVDTVRPTFLAPIDTSVPATMEGSGIRLRRMFPGGRSSRPSMWRAWLGFNISHGLGIFAFNLLCLLIATYDFELIEEIGALQPLTIAVSGAYLILSLRFWFYAPAIASGVATTCFALSYAAV